MGAFLEIDGKHWVQKIAKKGGVGLGEEIFLDHDTLERPRFQGSDIAEGTFRVVKKNEPRQQDSFAREISQSTNLSDQKARDCTCHPSSLRGGSRLAVQ